ncbi:MAG: hypothetical protein ACE5EY_03300 [Anaerolineae bacterium]
MDDLLSANGRAPDSMRRSLMTGLIFGRDEGEVQEKLDGRDLHNLQERGVIVGTPTGVVSQLGAFAEAGVQRIMLQWLDLDDLNRLEAFAHTVLHQV